MRGCTATLCSPSPKKWRDYKCDLKAKYYTNCLQVDRYEHRPKDIKSDHWQTIVDFWDFEEGQKISERNKRNRSCLKLPHTTGTKSFARIGHDEKSRPTPTSRTEVFLLTHVHKDGAPVNEWTREKIRGIKGCLPKDGSADPTPPNGVYSQVIEGKEKPGRVRGVGLGPTPTSLWGSSSRQSGSTSSEFTAINEKVHLLEEQLKQRDEQ